MRTQMIIKIEPSLKDKVNNLAKKEGKNLSELVRELLEQYALERDMSSYINDLWNSIGGKLDKKANIDEVIKQVRNENA